MSARDAILNRLRMARTGAATDRAEDVSAFPETTLEQRTALFREKMESVHTEVHEVGRSDWGGRLLASLRCVRIPSSRG